MDKTQLINRYSANDEQRILLSHIYDLRIKRDSRNVITVSNFLSDSECTLADLMLSKIGTANYTLYGGYPEAERRCVVFLPDYFSIDDIITQPALSELLFVKVSVDKFHSDAELSHRDVLGSLMGLGIERSSVGDIVADGNEAVFVIKSRLCDYIKDNMLKISRYNVNVNVFEHYNIVPRHDYVEDSDTVASMRLDAVVSSVFSISRSAASERITGGFVTVNGMDISSPM